MRLARSSRLALVVTSAIALANCSSPDTQNAVTNQATVSLRNLTETSAAAPARESYQIQGDLIPTPSDPRTRYYLLRQREPMLTDTIIAIIREERDDRIAYARVELDCARRLFHVLGVGNRRAFAEASIAYDGPLRPIEGLPLRQELASYVCQTNGTPLAKS